MTVLPSSFALGWPSARVSSGEVLHHRTGRPQRQPRWSRGRLRWVRREWLGRYGSSFLAWSGDPMTAWGEKGSGVLAEWGEVGQYVYP